MAAKGCFFLLNPYFINLKRGEKTFKKYWYRVEQYTLQSYHDIGYYTIESKITDIILLERWYIYNINYKFSKNIYKIISTI